MRTRLFITCLCCIGCILFSACNTHPAIPLPSSTILHETTKPTAGLTSSPTNTVPPTDTPVSINSETPTILPTATPTNTPEPRNEPGLIVTLGEPVAGPGESGIPVFSPDGKMVALASSKIRLWDVKTDQLIRELTSACSGDFSVYNAQFSPNSKLFAVSVTNCWKGDTIGHLIVSDISTGSILQELGQENAKMPPTSPTSSEYSLSVDAMAFSPDSASIIYASGNSVVIKDVYQKDKQDVIKLGPKMFASQLSLSTDGRFVYILMDWLKKNDFPANWRDKYDLQIWNMNNHAMVREIKYPEGFEILDLNLRGKYLYQVDVEKRTNQVINLENNQVRDLPLPKGDVIPLVKGALFYNADGSLMLVTRFFGLEDKRNSIELWTTDNWRNIYTFMPDFGPDWLYHPIDFAFNPDNSILAISHKDRLFLWNIHRTS